MGPYLLIRVLFGLTAWLVSPADAETVEAVLERARAAGLSATEAPQGKVLDCQGSTRYAGLDGRFRFVFAPDGRFRLEIDHELGNVVAFDGEHVMGTDRQGVTRRRVLGEADDARLVAALLGGLWLGSSPAMEVTLPDASDPDRIDVRWGDTPTMARLTLDDARLTGFERPSEAGATRWTLTQWHDVGGLKLPHEMEQLADGTIENRYVVEDARWIDDEDGLFHLDAGSTAAHSFDPEASPVLDVRRVRTGHQLVWAQLDGESAGWFIFDSGAGGLVITSSVADAHDMPVRGEVVAMGASGTSIANLRRGQSLRLGPLTLEQPVFVELDLSFLREPFGLEVAGIVGYDVLAHAVVELTPATDRIAVHDPDGYGLEGAAWSELLLDENIPTLRGRFEGEHDGLFHLDTGAGDSVTFHAPTVDRLGLLEGRELRGSRSAGVGGEGRMWNAPISSLELAGQRFEDVPARFATSDVGAFASAYTDGNLGQGLLGAATIVFDYAHGRLAWIPMGR
jgi:hypothetical protein